MLLRRYRARQEAEQERADFRAGIVAATIANVNRDRKKRPRPFTPADFMPTVITKKPRQSWEEQLAIVQVMTEVMSIKEQQKGAHP